jgi:rubrerythrin
MHRVKILVLLAGISVAAALGYSHAGAQQQLSPEARKGVFEALQNEAYASMKYKLFAEHARRAGKKELAELMEVTANQEYGHFLRWAAVYGLVGDDIQNLRDAIEGEVDGHEAFYSRLATEANARGDKDLVKHYEEIESQEDTHEEAFKKAVDKALASP